jgi:UPF0716 protein FxsA
MLELNSPKPYTSGMRLFFLLFVTVPLAELYVLIEVGSGIGGAVTILLCLATAALGGFLVRLQGISILIDAQKRMMTGDVPAGHMLHGIMLGIAGVLLLTPGFITDVAGFILLVPGLRRLIIHRYFPTAGKGGHGTHVIDVQVVKEPPGGSPPLL